MAPNSYGPYVSPEERQREQELESKYRDTVNKIPDKKGSNDPWGSVAQRPPRLHPPQNTSSHKRDLAASNGGCV